MRGPSATTKPSYPPPGDDGDPMRPVAAAAVGLRKKGTGVRAWLLLDAAGQTQVVKAGKHAIMRRTGLPARDLRILDPLLSYPSTVLGRERAIVINLEHIKAIITAQEVFLLNSHDPSVAPFVEGLRRRILRHHHDTKTQEGRANGDDSEWENLSDLEDPQSRSVSPKISSSASPQFLARDEESKVESKQGHDEESKVESKQGHDEESKVESKEDHDERRDSLKVLPFEFVALEACLEAACSCLDSEARTLEQEAHPALDKLTSKISTLNLERVRQIKSRLVAITGRVQKVRDELEHLLDDDEDMAEMYLTDKLLQQQLESSASSIDERDGMDDGVTQSEIEERLGAEISGEAIGDSTRYDGGIPPESLFNGRAISRASRGTRTSTTRSTINKHLDVEELEMLLEAYFVQIDGTLNKLSTLREYVDDTEDYINIMLDDKQNHLLQMGVTLTTATLVVSAFVVVAGIFGMNIGIDMFKDEGNNTGMGKWLWTVGGGTGGTIFLYVVAIAWCKKRRLLE